MSARQLVVLGTASQVPTRHRNHNGYLLRWDAEDRNTVKLQFGGQFAFVARRRDDS